MTTTRSAIAGLAVGVVVFVTPHAWAAKCDGDGADAADVQAARDAVQLACGCPSTGPTKPWRRCVRDTLRSLRDTGSLSKPCEKLAGRLERRSTCARTDKIVCCRTSGSGETKATIRADGKCKAPKHGSACASEHAHLDQACMPGGCAPIPGCGNLVVEPGETCDPPDGTTCDAQCQAITCPDGGAGTLLACHAGPNGVEIEGIGGTFLAAFNGEQLAGNSFVQIQRFDSTATPIDPSPLPLLPLGGTEISGVSGAAADGSEFEVVVMGTDSFTQAITHRAVPVSGAITDPINLITIHTPIGSCSEYLAGPVGVAPALLGPGVHTVHRRVFFCSGSTLFEILAGVPTTFAVPPPGNISQGPGSVARGANDVAVVWWNWDVVSLSPFTSIPSLQAGWVDPAPSTNFPLSLLVTPTDEGPVVAATGDTFLAAWAHLVAPTDPSPTEVRGVRFDRTGALDAPSLVLTTGGGAISQVVIDSDGTGFVVAWAEESGGGLELRAARVGTDGSIGPPIDLASVPSGTQIDVGASAVAAYLGYSVVESTGNTAVRVVPIPAP